MAVLESVCRAYSQNDTLWTASLCSGGLSSLGAPMQSILGNPLFSCVKNKYSLSNNAVLTLQVPESQNFGWYITGHNSAPDISRELINPLTMSEVL